MINFFSRQKTSEKKNKEKLLKELKKSPTPEMCCDLGDMCATDDDPTEAMQYYQTALQVDPHYARAFAGIGDICRRHEQIESAGNCYASAMLCAPDQLDYKLKFAALIKWQSPKTFNAEFANLIVDLMKADALRHCYSFEVWYRVLVLHPIFAEWCAAARHENYEAFRDLLDTNAESLADPFLIWGLKKVFVADLGFEYFVTYLRRYLLLHGAAEAIDVMCALSVYCLATGYILPVTEEEKEALSRISVDMPYQTALLACYEHIVLIRDVETVKKHMVAYPEFLDAHILTPLELVRIGKTIPALTPIEGEVSTRIQAQYEAFPYPLWTAYLTDVRDKDIEGRFKGKAAKILVAGCGTGREAIEHALAFPDSEVTAIDLSRASLSCAIKRANEIGVKNIKFFQADILKLPDWSNHFDYVSSSGVIHHMKNPEEGLAVLTRVLKPDGLMRLALYSVLARRRIIETQEIIRKEGYSDDAESMISFRQNAKQILPAPVYDQISKFGDFFFLPEWHDMVFNAQEHCFRLLEIKAMLARKNLEFQSFYLDSKVIEQFKTEQGGEKSLKDLDLWDKFEEKHPDTFIGMYAFWCTKRN